MTMMMPMTLMLGRHTYAKVFQLPPRQGLDFTFVTPAQGEGTFQIIQLKNRVVSRSLFFSRSRSRSRSRFASASVFLVFSFFFLFLFFVVLITYLWSVHKGRRGGLKE